MVYLIVAIIGVVAIAFVFYGKNKPTNQIEGLENQLTEQEIQLKQLELLKKIQEQTERSSRNLAFISWIIIISLIVSFFSVLNNYK